MKDLQCIIVSTPFQLISAFSIVEMNVEAEMDLYIIGNFKEYEVIAEKVIETRYFTNVTTYRLSDIRIAHESKKSFLRSFFRQLSYLNYNWIGKKIAKENRKYTTVYFAAAVSATELLLYFKRHYNPRFVLFDDGVMTYRNIKWVSGEFEKIQIIKKIIFKIIGNINSEIYVYLPELFLKLNPDMKNIKSINLLSENAKKKLCNIFQLNSNIKINQTIMVIESKTSDYLSDSSVEILEDIYEKIIEKFGNKKVIFKRHPRDQRTLVENRNYLTGTIPFELYGCIQNFSNKVILAWDSTAVLTPKMFFGQEPKIILLYRVINGKLRNYNETDKFYTAFSKMYSKSDRFLIPNTLEELNIILERI